jgi:hypothetical protein
MTAEELAAKIDMALERGLDLSSELRAKDPEGKPAISVKELTDLLKVAIEYYSQRRESPETPKWGAALGGSNGR